MTLEGENRESARFGSTVVNIGDINGDGTDGMFLFIYKVILFIFVVFFQKSLNLNIILFSNRFGRWCTMGW